jgi:ABC-type amino acid transport substrate-binding protein
MRSSQALPHCAIRGNGRRGTPSPSLYDARERPHFHGAAGMRATGNPLAKARLLAAAWLFALWLLPVVAASAASAPEPPPIRVIVATEPWDRLVYADGGNVPRGDIVDFVHRMNEVQHKFRFDVVLYPRLRLNEVFADRQADVYPFRTVAWTEPELGLQPTRTIISSGDVYFALRANHFGGQRVFAEPRRRLIAGVRGYHYVLFDNNPNEAYIRKRYKATLLHSNEAVVQFVLADRADIGIVPEMILARYLDEPATRGKLIVGGYDSRVELSNLVRKDGPISVAEMNAIIEQLEKSGDVDRLRRKYDTRKAPPPAQPGKGASPAS